MDMERYWDLGDLWTARARKVGRRYDFHNGRSNYSGNYAGENKHNKLAFILSQTHAALLNVWGAYHFSSCPQETVRRLEKELADWKHHCEIYSPQPLKEKVGTKIIETALKQFKSVINQEGA